ncbi:DUF6151 family protein [Mesorhizobium sp. VK4C]|uniref:GFA family protein n=1 Tax=Mesorhizobium captivum TaxID=3072319 RepID=UPI002A2463BD|nr:DUF6151 family protein [Mesorhizobium sp. VK4C]MDX8500642.1 DUF6151 family protein [Mesorhizobium sp. VK4C]
MSGSMNIGCACGATRLAVAEDPIIVTECVCDSCRAAAARLATLPGAKSLLTPYGATPSALYRKDRVEFLSGTEALAEFRLTPDAGTRRVVATCCNTPVFMEMKGAHWLDLYLHLWPDASRPKPDVRTMVGDLPDPSMLPTDIPNLKSQSVSFYAKLLWTWIAMGFRYPKLDIGEKIDA